MTTKSPAHRAALLAAFLGLSGTAVAQAPAVDSDDIGGTVNGPAGPEAGVWVIAETQDFATRYAKIVVTDDQGRYVVPDLPPANYQVWVRGYGLVDSAKVAGKPGQTLNLVANAAPSPAAAAVVGSVQRWGCEATSTWQPRPMPQETASADASCVAPRAVSTARHCSFVPPLPA